MAHGSTLWRSLEEDAAAAAPIANAGVRLARRDFLKFSMAAAALAGAGCQAPVEEIVARTDPEEAPEGVPRYFATALTLAGAATGVLVETNGGRPTKVEGNPAHPSSLGATDVFAQAAILELWNPQRSRVVRRSGAIQSRGALEAALRDALAALGARGGEGLRILSRYDA